MSIDADMPRTPCIRSPAASCSAAPAPAWACWASPASWRMRGCCPTQLRRKPARRKRRGTYVNPLLAEAAAFCGQGEAGDSPLHERRAVAGRYVRSQAALDEIRGPGAADAEPAHRAADGRRLSLAVQVPEVRRVRPGSQRALPAHGPPHRRHRASSARCTPTCRTTSRRCC